MSRWTWCKRAARDLSKFNVAICTTISTPQKKSFKSPQLHGYSWNGHDNSMQSGKTLQIQPKRTSTPPPPSPVRKGSISQVMIGKSAQAPSEDSVVDAGMRPHNNSAQSVKMTQLLPNKGPMQASLSPPPNTGLGFQVKITSAQLPHKDPDDDVGRRQNNNSRGPVKMTQLQPNKTSVASTLSSPHSTDLRSPATNTMSAQPLLKGFTDSVRMRANDIYKSQPVKKIAASGQMRLKCSNSDVSKRQSGDHNILFTPLGYGKLLEKGCLI